MISYKTETTYPISIHYYICKQYSLNQCLRLSSMILFLLVYLYSLHFVSGNLQRTIHFFNEKESKLDYFS